MKRDEVSNNAMKNAIEGPTVNTLLPLLTSVSDHKRASNVKSYKTEKIM